MHRIEKLFSQFMLFSMLCHSSNKFLKSSFHDYTKLPDLWDLGPYNLV
jgi:hypothetical protein